MATKFTDFNVVTSLVAGDYLVGHNAASNGEIRGTAQNFATSFATFIRPTWNNAGTTFYGIDLDVTNTASAAASKAVRVAVGSVNKFLVGVDGNAEFLSAGNAALTLKADTDANSATSTADILFDNNNGTTVGRIRWDESSTTLNLGYGANNHFRLNSSGNSALGGAPDSYRYEIYAGTSFLRLRNSDYDGSTTGSALAITSAASSGNTDFRMQVFNSGGGGVGNLYLNFAGGNVHVGGTTAPNKLTVTHDEATNTWASVSDAATDAVVKILGSNNATPYGLYLGYANSANNAQGIQAGDGTSALPLALNPFGGNVGIQTLSPTYAFQVRRIGGAGSLGLTVDNITGISRLSQYYSIGDDTSSTTGHGFYTRNATATDVLSFLVYPGGGYGGKELSSDPTDPPEGQHVIWQSDGTGSGDDGDIMIKITAGATTKTITLVDFSAF